MSSTFFPLFRQWWVDLRLKPLFQSTEAQPHNDDIQKSQALLASQTFFISNHGIVGARAFPYFRCLVYLALKDVLQDIKQGWGWIQVKPVVKLLYGKSPWRDQKQMLFFFLFLFKKNKVKIKRSDAIVSLYYSQAMDEFILVSWLFCFPLR